MIQTFLAILILGAGQADAIELSLEENRAQRGNIGFVDIQRIFKLFPETLRAKETFEDAVRQAEEQLNRRKGELIRMRAELERLKLEREAVAKGAKTRPAAPPPAPAPEKPQLEELLQPPGPPPAESTGTVESSTFTAAESTATIVSSLPGLTTGPVLAEGQSIKLREKDKKKKLMTYTDTAPTPPPAAPTVDAAALAALDERLGQLSAEIAVKEVQHKDRQAEAEKNLLDLESRRTEILLGKIHKAVKEVARREGVSVVVDKGAILYGQDAVDLTDRVLKALKGS